MTDITENSSKKVTSPSTITEVASKKISGTLTEVAAKKITAPYTVTLNRTDKI